MPNASKMLDDQIRALRTIQKQLERTLYDTDARGKPINTYYDPAIASGWMQISDKIIKAAAEKRLWLEAKVREAGDLTAVEQAEIATEFLVSSRAPIEAKKRALERIQASLSSIVVLREVK